MAEHVYKKSEFKRMHFDIHAARRGDWRGAFFWINSPQGHNWWADDYYKRGHDEKQRAELKRMVEQYDALYGEACDG